MRHARPRSITSFYFKPVAPLDRRGAARGAARRPRGSAPLASRRPAGNGPGVDCRRGQLSSVARGRRASVREPARRTLEDRGGRRRAGRPSAPTISRMPRTIDSPRRCWPLAIHGRSSRRCDIFDELRGHPDNVRVTPSSRSASCRRASRPASPDSDGSSDGCDALHRDRTQVRARRRVRSGRRSACARRARAERANHAAGARPLLHDRGRPRPPLHPASPLRPASSISSRSSRSRQTPKCATRSISISAITPAIRRAPSTPSSRGKASSGRGALEKDLDGLVLPRLRGRALRGHDRRRGPCASSSSRRPSRSRSPRRWLSSTRYERATGFDPATRSRQSLVDLLFPGVLA